jgi:hypothetical protein
MIPYSQEALLPEVRTYGNRRLRASNPHCTKGCEAGQNEWRRAARCDLSPEYPYVSEGFYDVERAEEDEETYQG